MTRAALPARASGGGSAYSWRVRVQSKLRPMKHDEYPASLTELREALKSGAIDPGRTLVCPPGETEFKRIEELRELAGGEDSAD